MYNIDILYIKNINKLYLYLKNMEHWKITRELTRKACESIETCLPNVFQVEI